MVPLPRECGGGYSVEHLGELDRILQREFRAAADREMRGVRGVAEEDEIAVAPALALDAAEVEPCGAAAQVLCVGHELVAVEIFREQLFAQRDGFTLVHAVEPKLAPGLFGTFDDE